MDTQTQKVRTATLTREVEASGLEVGTKVRVVSGPVPFAQYVDGTPGSDPAYFLVTIDEEQDFVSDMETTDDAFGLWDYGTTVWAEPQALQFDEDES